MRLVVAAFLLLIGLVSLILGIAETYFLIMTLVIDRDTTNLAHGVGASLFYLVPGVCWILSAAQIRSSEYRLGTVLFVVGLILPTFLVFVLGR